MRLTILLSLLPSVALAGPYSLTKIIPWIPANTGAYDGSTINNGTYYLSDLQNGVVRVVDVASATEITRIGDFVGLNSISGHIGRDSSGPSGMIAVPDRNELYVGDGDGTVKVIDLKTNTILASIDLSVNKRADELGYDAAQRVVAVTAPDITIPTLFFISVTTRQVIANLTFPDATDGIEVPSWNAQDGNWYLSIPSSVTNPGGEIAAVDPKSFKVVRTVAEPPCNSAGTAFGAPHSHVLFLGCSQNSYFELNNTSSYIISTSSGKVVSTVKDVVGSDQIAYSQNLNLFFASAARNRASGGSSDPILAIVDAERGNVVQSIVTDNVTAHAVAVDEIE
ncbi:uncharacterized protein PAC_07909 [Phialocephala subalpina]|uniref:Uncharacterized protein n=1 Tax=Phialocephala subalpina TaxID=576137 RepID=A0A1L7WZ17_9HELO|nr:uncharacterized protein PAC_07909 [Phialocephala subalpina]